MHVGHIPLDRCRFSWQQERHGINHQEHTFFSCCCKVVCSERHSSVCTSRTPSFSTVFWKTIFEGQTQATFANTKSDCGAVVLSYGSAMSGAQVPICCTDKHKTETARTECRRTGSYTCRQSSNTATSSICSSKRGSSNTAVAPLHAHIGQQHQAALILCSLKALIH